MTSAPALRPTLWRTCRVLANRTRLQLFGLLVQQAPQTVSELALRLELALPVASQYLRALEARGMLTSLRVGRRVDYRPSAVQAESAHELVVALRSAFQRGASPIESLFRLSTAFTHPRRIELFRALQTKACSLSELRTATGISVQALQRHLGKLEARGFVACRLGIYSATTPAEGFGRALARLAAG